MPRVNPAQYSSGKGMRKSMTPPWSGSSLKKEGDADEVAVVKESVDSVLRQRKSEREGCLSLPFTVAFFVFYSLSLSYHEDVRNVYLVESSVRNFFEEYDFDVARSRTLHEVTQLRHIWMYLQDSLIPAVFRQADHLGHPLPQSDWSIILGKNKLHGGVLVEQYRPKGAEPPGNPEMLDASSRNFSKSLYFPGEGRVANSDVPYASNPKRRLRGAKEVGGAMAVDLKTSQGDQKAYSFFLFEQEPVDMIEKRLKYLEDLRWVDDSTTQVSLKMVLINEEVGLCQRVTIRFALLSTGGIFSALSIQSSFLESYRDVTGVLVDVVWMALLLWIFGIELKEVIVSIKTDQLRKYFHDFWNCLDWATIVAGWAIVICFIQGHHNISNLKDLVGTVSKERRPDIEYLHDMSVLHTTADDHASFAMWYRLTLGYYMMLIMLRLFKAFKGQARLAVVTSTIYHAGSDLVHFGVVFMSIFVTFALTGCLLFGRRLVGFSNFNMAFGTCFAMLCGEFEWATLSAQHPVSSLIWFCSFMILVFFVMLNMVLAIVMDVYTRVRADAVMGDPIWIQTAELLTGLYRQTVRFLKGRDKSLSGEPLDVQDNELLKGLGKIHAPKITTSKLVAMVPHLSEEQANRLLRDAEAWQVMQDEKGMSLSDAMKLITKINAKVNGIHGLVFNVNQEVKGQDKNMKGKKGGVLARKAVKRRARRALFNALWAGDLERIAERLRCSDMQEKVRQMELQRKIKVAESMLQWDNAVDNTNEAMSTKRRNYGRSSSKERPSFDGRAASRSNTFNAAPSDEVGISQRAASKNKTWQPCDSDGAKANAFEPTGANLEEEFEVAEAPELQPSSNPKSQGTFFTPTMAPVLMGILPVTPCDMKDGQRNSDDCHVPSTPAGHEHQELSKRSCLSADTRDGQRSADQCDHLVTEVTELSKRIESLHADFKDIRSLVPLLNETTKEISTSLKGSGALEKAISEVSSCLRGLHTALCVPLHVQPAVPQSSVGSALSWANGEGQRSETSVPQVPKAPPPILPATDQSPQHSTTGGTSSSVSQSARANIEWQQTETVVPKAPFPISPAGSKSPRHPSTYATHSGVSQGAGSNVEGLRPDGVAHNAPSHIVPLGDESQRHLNTGGTHSGVSQGRPVPHYRQRPVVSPESDPRFQQSHAPEGVLPVRSRDVRSAGPGRPMVPAGSSSLPHGINHQAQPVVSPESYPRFQQSHAPEGVLPVRSRDVRSAGPQSPGRPMVPPTSATIPHGINHQAQQIRHPHTIPDGRRSPQMMQSFVQPPSSMLPPQSTSCASHQPKASPPEMSGKASPPEMSGNWQEVECTHHSNQAQSPSARPAA